MRRSCGRFHSRSTNLHIPRQPDDRPSRAVEKQNRRQQEVKYEKYLLHTVSQASFHCRLLSQEAKTTLTEIKGFHQRVCVSQGRSEEAFLSDCMNIDLSIDGVTETTHGKRKFVFVTARFGPAAIYIVKVMNPLVGDTNAKPSPYDVLG